MGGAAIALHGFVIEATFRDNFLIADLGIGTLTLLTAAFRASSLAAVAPPLSSLVLTGCAIRDNLMICPFASMMLGDVTRQQGYCFYLLETAIDGNTVLSAALGIFVEGLTDPGASLRISRNDLEVNVYGIVTALDAAIISDNIITQGDVAQLLRGGPATFGTGIYVLGVPEYPLPLFEVRLHRNRIAAIAGPGIVLDAPAVAVSVTDNTIQGAIGDGIAIGALALVGDLRIRGNEVLAVSGPAGGEIPWVMGILAGSAANMVLQANTVGGIANAQGQLQNAAGIGVINVAAGLLTGNNISDVGSTTGAGGAVGIAAVLVQVGVTVSDNVIPQATGMVTRAGYFTGIRVLGAVSQAPTAGAAAPPPPQSDVALSVQGNHVEGSSQIPLIELLVLTADCVGAGNYCRLLAPAAGGFASFGSPTPPIVLISSATAIASNNRIQRPKGRPGLEISAASNGVGGNPAATVVGNIASEAIHLNGPSFPSQSPWPPLNIIVSGSQPCRS